MATSLLDQNTDPLLKAFIAGKSAQTLELLRHFIAAYVKLDKKVYLYPTKSMIGIGSGERRVAWVTQLGKNFVHIVFPFQKPYEENLCFQKIAQVPGDRQQFNHHFRMLLPEDINEEVQQFMRLSLHP
ncbi:hypothetical protein [Chitinophaga arvensicola]|uniref:DUF5655 domain-containing protein n=1 Tax=Chitinophaga arvensicola TaxID=29529 RepID=A0A1I0S9S9_9BACT|nr:hypothetical protein [Chitinophaga arvensicola]SEW52975.1 hypothetical protein SAMN04488122_5272 [Chitinophaga arvensicola]